VKLVVITILLFVTLCDVPRFFAQAKPCTSGPRGDQGLEMTTIGSGHMFGHAAAFRTSETPDHTEAMVWYGKFRSEQEAKHATKQSLREHKVTCTEHIKDLNGRVIGDRIVATPKGEKKASMVIRKQGLNYWIIQSVSLPVAMQVERLIEPPREDTKQLT
jgi:hypothetical protein